VSHAWTETLGWAATATFVGSYFFPRPALLRAAQMAGAILWMTYGVLIRELPVIVANILVFSAAAWTMVRPARTLPERTSGPVTAEPTRGRKCPDPA
jgi:hypothetical protein